ncbi:hypothetical protein PISL3812_07049 [Talaromyces islandicus]|uniref:Xylanolytic transcriptional activator regulatory domain-containing protein n=1 Tax=Talaromyces islandicus TaxID=28573 RepID=A0A0U1M339_TALIS|nr:hypothetical protein PISL3812_07049 [Talaromyces islandicus]
MRTAHSRQRQSYGRSSSFYFIGRLSSYLGVALQQPSCEDLIQLDSASRSFSSPVVTTGRALNRTPVGVSTTDTYLTRSQEEYFLNRFWTTYHTLYPVIDRADFDAHYGSLWSSETARNPSALVDILVAICMQYSDALVPQETSPGAPNLDNIDTVISGRRFYARCQLLLADELEGPSIATLQCHIFSVIYLSNASFQNTAHGHLAFAIRTGIILGLHWKSPEKLADEDKEFRKRLWWTVYALEMKMAMDLGRPLAVNMSQVTCSLPKAPQNSSTPGVNDFTFNEHYVKLILAARSVYVIFHNKCAEVLAENDGRSLYHDLEALEKVAECVSLRMEDLRTWQRQVPDLIKSKRMNCGKPFSTDRSALDLREHSSTRLRRQRLMLELLQHNLAMSLYRPFICFSRVDQTPFVDANAASCANHAITITNIVNQVLNESHLLAGLHEVFQWQWNAAISLIGYIAAYPTSPLSTASQNSFSIAIAVFDILGRNLPIASSAAKVARDILKKVELLVLLSSNNTSTVTFDPVLDSLTRDSLPQILAYESFNSLESIYTGLGNVSDIWNFEDPAELFSPWMPYPSTEF